MAKKLKTLPQLKKDLDKVFNEYIRRRDTTDGYFTCIACGEVKPYAEADCGHYFPKSGYDGIRYNEDNSSAECRKCNRFSDGHLIGYTHNLIKKIGNERYKKLLDDANDYRQNGRKYTRGELMEMIAEYKLKLKK